MPVVDITEATENARAQQAGRAAAERERVADERKEHERQVAAMAKKRSKELEEAMGCLEESERRLVRLHAVILVKTQGYSGGNLQERLDDEALAIAQYMATGIA